MGKLTIIIFLARSRKLRLSGNMVSLWQWRQVRKNLILMPATEKIGMNIMIAAIFVLSIWQATYVHRTASPYAKVTLFYHKITEGIWDLSLNIETFSYEIPTWRIESLLSSRGASQYYILLFMVSSLYCPENFANIFHRCFPMQHDPASSKVDNLQVWKVAGPGRRVGEC